MIFVSRKISACALTAVVLSSLASCQSQLRTLENVGALRVEPSQQPGSDYVVHMQNAMDIGYTPDDKANRDKWALAMLKSQCTSPRIVDERHIVTGKFGTGREARTYFVYIKC